MMKKRTATPEFRNLEELLELENTARKQITRPRIIRNAVQCTNCWDIIESTSRHDFRTCSCGKVSVDGGHDYLSRCYESADGYIDLSETIDPEDDESCGKTEDSEYLGNSRN